MGQTIVAPATAPGRAAVGIIRISGPRARAALLRVAPSLSELEPRRAYLATFRDAERNPIDRGLVLFFSAPASATGEDLAELHAHGGVGVMARLQNELLRDDELRLAEAGEFTRRAVVNGKLDWLQAEALGELLGAETEAHAAAAARQLAGEYGQRLERLQNTVTRLAAEVEGMLAFPGEADAVEAELLRDCTELRASFSDLLARVDRGALLRRTPRVVLAGPVNAGKSTLFNRIVGAERALVDAEPGTTRDSLEAKVEWKGQSFVWIDTAGFRVDAGRIERLGIERSWAEIGGADAWVWLVPPELEPAAPPDELLSASLVSPLVVRSKADLRAPEAGFAVSGHSGEGVTNLLDEVARRLQRDGTAGGAFFVHAWHREVLATCGRLISDAQAAADSGTWDAAGLALVGASQELAAILGEPPPAVSDDIFSRFCIGK